MDRLAVCPGSFDPVTNGHIDVITRTAKLFDKVIVLVMYNHKKRNQSFSPEERVEFIYRCIKGCPNVAVDFYDGLLADYVTQNNAVAIVKGLRAATDFEDEFQQALTNKRLAPEVETVFITTRAENMFLSSSMVKQVCELGGDISPFVPEVIRNDIVERLFTGKEDKHGCI